MKLTKFDHVPDALLSFDSKELFNHFAGPMLISLKGQKSPTLFVSCLVHGNEYTGLLVVQELLKRYQGKELPRDVMIFVGNVEAAAQGRRHLDSQPDYNRIWKPGDLPEHKMAGEVLEAVKAQGLFASVDIHNNTGRNPHYSVITKRDDRMLALARLFSDKSLYFEDTLGAQTGAMSELGPAITLEAGMPGVPDGTEHVLEYLETLLSFDELPASASVEQPDFELLRFFATIKIADDSQVKIAGTDVKADLVFGPDYDLYNFVKIPTGTCFAQYETPGQHLLVPNLEGNDMAGEFFEYQDGKILIKKEMMPSMMTLDTKILKTDCVGYLLERA